MPLDIGESINYMADLFLKAPIINTIATNPIYTAMVITFIVMLIVMVVFRDAETEEPLLKMILGCGFWVFLSTLTILFLHNKILTEEKDVVGKNEAYDGVFGGNYSGAVTTGGDSNPTLEDSIVPIHLNAKFE